MNTLGLIAWCAVLCIFLLDIIFYSFFSSLDGTVPRGSLLILGILCMLPMIPAVAQQILSEFSPKPLFGFPVMVSIVLSCFSGILIYILFEMSILSAIILSFLIGTLVLRIGGKIAFSFALIMLILVPVCLVSGYNTEAETLSVYVYYFLVIGVLSELVVPNSLNKQENEAC